MKILTRDLHVIEVEPILRTYYVGITSNGRALLQSDVLRVSEPKNIGFFSEHNDAFEKIATRKLLNRHRWKVTQTEFMRSKKINEFYARIDISTDAITHFEDSRLDETLYWSESEQTLYREACGYDYAKEYYELMKQTRRYKKIVKEMKLIYSENKQTPFGVLKNLLHTNQLQLLIKKGKRKNG